MTRIVISIFCLFLLTVCHNCDGQTYIDSTKSLLWRVSGNGLIKPSYLFGTIHILCPDDLIWTKKMKQSFDSCEVACFEVNLSRDSIKAHLSISKNKNGIKLKSYFITNEYIQVRNYFLDKGAFDIDTLQDLKLISLYAKTYKIDEGCSRIVSYDLMLSYVAQMKEKKISSLESFDEQEKLLDAIPNDALVKALVERANGSLKYKNMLKTLTRVYKEQDQELLHEIITRGVLNIDAMVDERNKKWIPRMARLMENNSVFFAFGVAHLGGEFGVINLLKKAGYEVEPLRDTGNEQVGRDKRPSPDFDLNEYLSQHIHYPKQAQKQNIQGRVLIKFVVNEDGTIGRCSVEKGIGHGCDEEALRVVSTMPAWKPCIHNGVAVKFWFTLPVEFRLR